MKIRARRALHRFGAVAITVTALSAAAGNAAPGDAPPAPGAQTPEAGQSPGAAQPDAGQQPGVQAPQALDGEVSDEKLRQFAEAAEEVQKIQQEYAAKAQSLQKTTEEKIVSSVQDAGMTVAEFTAIVERMQTDPTLAQRLDGLQTQ